MFADPFARLQEARTALQEFRQVVTATDDALAASDALGVDLAVLAGDVQEALDRLERRSS